MLGIFLQIICASLGATAVILVGCKRHCLYKWGYLVGIMNTPMWIAVEIYYAQWFLLPINIFYIWGWIQGYKNNWKGEPSEWAEALLVLRSY